MAQASDRLVVSDASFLMTAEPSLRAQRALRRELCFTRTVVLAFTLLCTAASVLLFTEHFSGCKTTKNGDNGTDVPQVEAQVGGPGSEELPLSQAHQAFLKIDCKHLYTSPLGLFTWEKIDLVGFSLNKENNTLIFPSTGMYRVALQVTYRGTDQVSSALQMVLQHHLDVFSDSYPKDRTILSAFETIYYESTSWRKSVYSEVILHFGMGDRLKVKTIDLKLVDCDGNPGIKTFLTVHPHGIASVGRA